MTIVNDIREALESHLDDATGLPAIAYPNVDFEQAPGTAHIRVEFIPTSRRPANRGPNPQHRHQGLFVMTVCVPEQKGAGAGLNYVDDLLARFNGSTDVAGDAVTVSIDYSESGAPFYEAPFYCIPVSVAWYVYET